MLSAYKASDISAEGLSLLRREKCFSMDCLMPPIISPLRKLEKREMKRLIPILTFSESFLTEPIKRPILSAIIVPITDTRYISHELAARLGLISSEDIL